MAVWYILCRAGFLSSTKLLSDMFVIFLASGPYCYITIKPKKSILYPQGLLNSLINSTSPKVTVDGISQPIGLWVNGWDSAEARIAHSRFRTVGLRVVVKMMVLVWVLSVIRHLVWRGPKRGDHNLDNHPHRFDG